MGYGFQKKKKTAKALEADTKHLATNFQQGFAALAGSVQEIGSRLKAIGTQSVFTDTRSLATLRLLIEKGIVTNEESEKMAETIRIEGFDEQNEVENQRLGLKPSAGGIGPRTVFTFKIDAEYPLESDRVGEHIPELSMLRSRIEFGQHHDIFPAVFEEQLLGAIAGDVRLFTITCPKTFSTFADKPVTFRAQIFSVMDLPALPEPEEVSEEAEAPSNVVSLTQPN